MTYSKHFLIEQLRRLDLEHGDKILTVVNVRADDPFNWSSLGPCRDCGLPGIDFGQLRDCRYPTEGPEGLHAHVYHDRYAFHLDAVDACRDVANHGVKDTRLVEGALLGAGAGVVASALSGGKGGAGAGAAIVGALLGGVLGASIPARQRKEIEFHQLIAEHGFGFGQHLA